MSIKRYSVQGGFLHETSQGSYVRWSDVEALVKWRPIKEAPKETHVLFAHVPCNHWRGIVRLGYVDERGKVYEDGRCGWLIDPQPEYWLPVPNPPQEKGNV